MEITKLEELIKLMESTNLTALEVEEEGLRVRMERQQSMPQASPPVIIAGTPSMTQAFMPQQPAGESEEGVIDMNLVKTVKASMVGIFYAAPKPGAEPYVARGSKVKKGDTLCIIEAMKLMNEIASEYDGEIADICVETGQMVEFGQTLFKIY